MSAGPLAAETTYTDRTTFEAAVSGAIQTETFDLDIAQADTIIFDNDTESAGSMGVGLLNNVVSGGRWDARIRNVGGGNGYLSITWTFAEPTNAIGVDWGSISSTRGVTLTGNWDGTGNESFEIRTFLGAVSDGFFGVIGDTTFTEVTLSANGTGDNDLFWADNLTLQLPAEIFEDGFESGDTTAWDIIVN